ncbi:hypothetical protein [Thiolinea disciformis]|uniref:hypothetical protein n=1 Tax=Thiolinea disciformis TaxID=125614 RepID=UPI0012FEC9FF|nr:hypothetical protein [Thiolinea disciformis]
MLGTIRYVARCQWLKVCVGLIALTLMLPVQAGDIGVMEEDGLVRLVATLRNNPAFTNVVWRVYRLDNAKATPVTISRHMATLKLKPGDYKAVAFLNNKERSQSFSVKPNTKENIVVPMD